MFRDRRETTMTPRSIAIVIGVALGAHCLPQSASAQTIGNGRSLKERCATFQLTNPSAGLACRGYIGAVVDILAAGNTIDGYRACPPSDAKREELIRSVKTWLDRHQDLLERKAHGLAAAALSERFPCPDE
jgi:hypothetical protein